MHSPKNWHKIWFTYTAKLITKLKRIGYTCCCYSCFRITRYNPRSSLSYSIFHRKRQQNKTNDQWRCALLAVLTYRNSFIHFKLLIMPMAYVFFLPVEKRKWRKRNQSRVKKKTLATFFTKIRIPKRMSRKRVAHSDNIIVSLFTMGCCKGLSCLNVWEFFFNHEKQLP